MNMIANPIDSHSSLPNQRGITLEQARQYIEKLDLHYIVDAMCAEGYPLPRWVQEEALQCMGLYKDFLLLKKKHISESLVPTREIDEFWHNHILYTQHYFYDCQQIFGHYLHHEPASQDGDKEMLVREYLKTKQFYLDEFKRPLTLVR